MTTYIRWLPILSDEVLSTSFVFQAYFIAQIKNPHKTQSLLKHLNEIYPMHDRSFKRIKTLNKQNDKKLMLLVARDDEKYKGLPNEIEEEICNLDKIELPEGDVFTRRQYEIMAKHWPLTFRENKHLESLLNDTFNENSHNNELKFHDSNAKQVQHLSETNSNRRAALIVDPIKRQIISSAFDTRDKHPLEHCVINAIHKASIGSQNDCDYVKHDESSYLCTGYYVYLTHEPCGMCTMALVHSRVSKIFYLNESKHGFLGTKYKLNCIKELNHRFEVFKAISDLDRACNHSQLTKKLKNIT